jgi:hypothetical protein
MRQISRRIVLGFVAVAAGIAIVDVDTSWRPARADQDTDIGYVAARVVAINIPGASAIAQVGDFLNLPGACASPIPTKFPNYTLAGAILDQKRLLVGSRSNFGAPLASGVGLEGSFLSIDPTGPSILVVPPNFAASGGQASTLGGAVQMFSANSPTWANAVNNPSARTSSYTGVSNPLGLSNNNGFGRIWPANAPFGDNGVGSSSILDPTGLPLAGAPSNVIGGVYAGDLTNRNVVAMPQQPQVIPGALNAGGVATALLGPSPDGTCKAVFVVVTADGAIVQEHTLKGLDGLAPAGTVRPLPELGFLLDQEVGLRFGMVMNPYTQAPVLRQLFVTEPFANTIAVINLVEVGPTGNQVFGLGSVSRIGSHWLNFPVDITPVKRDGDDVRWASNSTLDQGSDFYVANRGDNTIVRMHQDGSVVAVRYVGLGAQAGGDDLGVRLNGIAASTDGTTIYVTVKGLLGLVGGVLAVPAF